MENKLSYFQNELFGVVRVLVSKGMIWFAAKDVTVALGYANSSDIVSKYVDYVDVNKFRVDTSMGVQELSFINEVGLGYILCSSKKPNVKELKDWLVKSVIPSIREGVEGLEEVPPVDLVRINRGKKNKKKQSKSLTQYGGKYDICILRNTYTRNAYVWYTTNARPSIIDMIDKLSKNKHESDVIQRDYNKYGRFFFSYDVIENISIPITDEGMAQLAVEQAIEDLQEMGFGTSYVDNYSEKCRRGTKASRIEGLYDKMSYEHRDDVHRYKALEERTNERYALSDFSPYRNFAGRKHSAEAKRKMSEKAKNRKMSEETKQKISLTKSGVPLSEETKKKIADSVKTSKKKNQLEKAKTTQKTLKQELKQMYKKSV